MNLNLEYIFVSSQIDLNLWSLLKNMCFSGTFSSDTSRKFGILNCAKSALSYHSFFIELVNVTNYLLFIPHSQTCLRHPESQTAKENRTTVFCQMRRAIDLIHYVVKNGVWEGGGNTYASNGAGGGCNATSGCASNDGGCGSANVVVNDEGQTLSEVLRNLDSLVEMTRLTLTLADKDSLNRAVDFVVDRTQDFTDSAYTSHEHRENIILLRERIKIQLEQLVRIASGLVSHEVDDLVSIYDIAL